MAVIGATAVSIFCALCFPDDIVSRQYALTIWCLYTLFLIRADLAEKKDKK